MKLVLDLDTGESVAQMPDVLEDHAWKIAEKIAMGETSGMLLTEHGTQIGDWKIEP